MAKYTLKKKSRHKYMKNRKNYTFEAILCGVTITITSATLGVVTIYSPNFNVNPELIKPEKIQVSKINELSEEEISYFTNKAKNYYLNTSTGNVEIFNGSAFVDYDNVESQSNEKEETFEEKTIKKYCAIYQVDYDIVYKKLAELTDNFTSEEYLNGTIPKITLKDEPVNFSNPETLLLVAVRCCKQTPEAVGLSCIGIEDYYVTDESLLEQISYYSELFQTDRNLAYAIIYSENNFGSDFTDKTNNLPSIKFAGKFVTFDNLTQSIIELCTELYRHNKNGLYSIDEIGPIYAPIEDDNKNWIPNVKENYEKAENVFIENELIEANKL